MMMMVSMFAVPFAAVNNEHFPTVRVTKDDLIFSYSRVPVHLMNVSALDSIHQLVANCVDLSR